MLGETSTEAATGADEHGEALLRVQDVSVAYAGVQALHEVSLDVPERAIVGVLGNNGAGKTTLLRAISGTLAAHRGAVTGGAVELAGAPLLGRESADVARAGVVQVPEGRRIFSHLTVEENLRAGGLAARDKAARERARSWVHELFPILAERAHQRAGLLSGGEQQMLAIGRALMAGPRVLLLDEPSLGLAPRVVAQIGEVIGEINRAGRDDRARRAERGDGAGGRRPRRRARGRPRRARRRGGGAGGDRAGARPLPGRGGHRRAGSAARRDRATRRRRSSRSTTSPCASAASPRSTA